MSDKRRLPEMMELDIRSAFEKALSLAAGDERSREATRRLLDRYGSVTTIFSEDEENISRISGLNANATLLVKLLAYINARRVTDSFEFGVEHNELELREFIAALFLGLSVETVYILLLDDNNRVISANLISEGTVNMSDIIPRKILECAKKRKSSRFILAHNHPRGSITPSKDDIITTGRLFNFFSTVGLRLCAHYIVADGEVGRIETDMIYNPEYKDCN